MNISTTTKTVTLHTLELDDADVAKLLADPWAFGEGLRDRFTPNGNGKHTRGGYSIARKPRKTGGG